jgi:hypothetical protein
MTSGTPVVGGPGELLGAMAATAETQIFDGMVWSLGPALPAAVAMHGQVLLRNGGVHVSGGSATYPTTFPLSTSAACAVFDGAVLQSTTLLPQNRFGHAIVPLEEGAELIVGSRNDSSLLPPFGFSTLLASSVLYTPSS